jgi:hypothetical protein
MGTSREDATRGCKHRGLDQPSKQARCEIHRMHPEKICYERSGRARGAPLCVRGLGGSNTKAAKTWCWFFQGFFHTIQLGMGPSAPTTIILDPSLTKTMLGSVPVLLGMGG